MGKASTITLEQGDLTLALAPSIGGAITGFWRNGFALMRETPDQALQDGLVRLTSSYPLIPYSNRIAQGRFSFDGAEHRLALNFGDHPHSIHGNAWQKPWELGEADGARCCLALRHRPVGNETKGWPFAYRAEQIFELDAAGLTLTLLLENEDEHSMPAGLGLHPFFPKRPGVGLQFSAEGVYRNGDDALPAESSPAPEEWNYRTMREVGDPRVDNCFRGWDGKAAIRFGEDQVGIRIVADPVFSHLVVYVPSGRDFFAIEPVSHMNNAINRPDIGDHGLRVLAPGERLVAQVRFHVEALS